MMQLLAFLSVISLVFGIVRNLRTLIVIGALGSVGFFGYLIYTGLDAEMAFDAVKGFWESIWDFVKRGGIWAKDVLPF